MSTQVVRLKTTKRPRKVPGMPPVRVSNASVRSREYLTPDEVARLIKAAGKKTTGKGEGSRYGLRDQAAITLAYRHGLRVSELVSLRWDQVDLKAGLLHVKRAKNGTPSTHPLRGPELRALRALKRDWQDNGGYVLTSERGGPMTDSNVRKMVAKAGVTAKLSFPVHPHMLRHACGFKLANEGHDTRSLQHWLGHKNIQHTVTYTNLSPDRFKNFWRD